MRFNRRELLRMATVGGMTSPLASAASPRVVRRPAIRAVAFDAFAIFDPRPIAALAERLFPGRGRELTDAWRTRQFEYQWLRLVSGRYVDFWHVTADALSFAADLLRLPITERARRQLMEAYLALTAWPDVEPALLRLRQAGLRSAILSNATRMILHAGVTTAGLDGVFEHVLSTDAQRTYKPDPRAYRQAQKAFRLEVDEILFVPSAGWDAAGAKSFGYRTFWVNRMGLPAERLDLAADEAGRDLEALADFLGAA
jgi:2-haloacid dehalogenase